ncbi:PEGA domain-containing protein [Sorangium sp. So ce1000]|uniref:PEGA domain-containing protein n=1 Tax=Sorangium sp. So ce1000 TaxID=3133325 RepID=UPI003F633C51
MMNRRCLASVLTLACALAPSGRALAQPAPPQSAAPAQGAAPDEATARADALYKQGVRLYSEKKWKEAEAVFLEAWALTPTFDVAYNVGSAAYQQGKHALAAEHLSFALRHWPLLSAVAHLKPTAQQRLATSRAQVGALAVTVNAPLAEVLVDGKPAGKAPLAGELFVEPGEHTVEARLDGYAPAQKTVRVGKGETAAVTLAMVAKGDAAAKHDPATDAKNPTASRTATTRPGTATGTAPTLAVPPRASVNDGHATTMVKEPRSLWPAVALGATSIVALGVGVGMTAASSSARQESDEQREGIRSADGRCIEPPSGSVNRCEAFQRNADDAEIFGTAALVSYVAAGALATAATAYLLWPRRSSPASTGVQVFPTVRADGGALLLVGAW